MRACPSTKFRSRSTSGGRWRASRARGGPVAPRLILWVCALVVALAGCNEERTVLAPASLPPSMKGYELYSWKSGQTWVFKLMVGTNRLKTLDEVMRNVTSADTAVSARGVDELKAALGELPDDAQVVWRGPEALARMGIGPGDLALPTQTVLDEITRHAEQAGVGLVVVR